MRISPISNINYYNRYNQRKNSPVFTAHPDFNKLSKNYDITASSYFRRGPFYGSPSEEYIDVVKIFNNVFSVNDHKPKNILIVGIGDSQETFSHLATIKKILNGRKLNKNVKLYTVDLQSKPNNYKLFKSSFYDSPFYPEFSGESFIKDDIEHGYGINLHYRVSDDIYEFVRDSYNNRRKSKWDSRIQEVVRHYPDNKFNIISANNVISYIAPTEDAAQTVIQLKRTLKPKGYLITDPIKYSYMKRPEVMNNLREVYEGIYQKIE